MFVNFTNHPSDKWSQKQKNESQKYGTIVDLPFPNIDPEINSDDITIIADEYVEKILKIEKNPIVLCQGEMSLMFTIINRLMDKNIKVVCATTERIIKEKTVVNETIKESKFVFCKYREYKR